jgi:hypothetical protein
MVTAKDPRRAHGAARLVLAVPVAPAGTSRSMADIADEIVCLDMPAELWSVGWWYEDFRPVSDVEVIDLLDRTAAGRQPDPAVAVDIEVVIQAAAVVSRDGRPELAAPRLSRVTAPTLLVVGGRDEEVLRLNRAAASMMRCKHRVSVVPGATHLFEEPSTLRAARRTRPGLVYRTPEPVAQARPGRNARRDQRSMVLRRGSGWPCLRPVTPGHRRTMGSALLIEGLHKSYGAVHAVAGAHLAVDEGEIIGLLGPNGSGKTTTVECAYGLAAG